MKPPLPPPPRSRPFLVILKLSLRGDETFTYMHVDALDARRAAVKAIADVRLGEHCRLEEATAFELADRNGTIVRAKLAPQYVACQ